MPWTLVVALARLTGAVGIGNGSAAAWGLAAVAISGLVVVAAIRWLGGRAVTGPSSPAAVDALALRRRAFATAFLRLRDPDSAGRARPRAPSRSAAG